MNRPIDFLQENASALPGGTTLLVAKEAPLLHLKPLYDELLAFFEFCAAMDNVRPVVIALVGEKGSGKKFLAAKLAEGLGLSALKIDASCEQPIEELNLALILYSALPCVENANTAQKIQALVQKTGIVIAFYQSLDEIPNDLQCAVLKRQIPVLDTSSAKRLQQTMLAGIEIPEEMQDDAMLLALNPGQLETLAAELFAEQTAVQAPVPAKTIKQILRSVRPVQIAGAQRLECAGTLKDIVLPAELTRQLSELCAFAKMRSTVYTSWGFGEKTPWGRGISALFYGSPGTGKTMAAAVLANEVNLPLMRIDLSQLTSKYIGETQKNIGKIFDEAEKADCILFFDEADAIFARRTESSDSQDKYANAETAYLLQRMESYDGICLLATNLLQNFDEAFRRRIGYMLHFPLPDASLREKIWRGVFPTQAPVENLDYSLLAQQLELSGASIKNCVIHAAYLAAIHNSSITMDFLFAGAKNEYQKLGKSLSPQLLQMTFA